MGISTSSYMGKSRSIKDYPGNHAAEIVETKAGRTNQGDNQMFIVDLLVHASDNEELQKAIDAAGAPVPCGAVSVMNSYQDYFWTEIKMFLGCMEGIDPSVPGPQWDAPYDAAVGGNPYKGELVAIETFDTGKLVKSGKNAGKKICDVRWSKPTLSE